MGVLGRLFARHPMLANTATSGGLLALGDAIQQGIEFRRGVHADTTYNWRRTGRMLLVGLAEGPPHVWWYTWLDRMMPGRGAAVVRRKIVADQLVAAPLFALTFFVGMDLLEGRSLRDGLQEFRRKFPEVYLFDWCIWPPTQWLNFTYVPERYRVLYVNVVTVVWDVFLSYSKHRDQLESEQSAPAELEPLCSQRRTAQLTVSALQSDARESESDARESESDARESESDSRESESDSRESESDARESESDARESETDWPDATECDPAAAARSAARPAGDGADGDERTQAAGAREVTDTQCADGAAASGAELRRRHAAAR